MNWVSLKAALSGMKADGDNGFEGLVARLFECETGQRFFVARKGDQPSSDAYGPAAATTLQTKRITSSSVRENDIEGDIDRALREVPVLDVYVVATTRASAQLRLRLAQKTRETGLDIVLLDLTDTASEFGALCVQHPDIMRVFVPDWDVAWDRWAVREAGSAGIAAALARLRSELAGFQTQRIVAREAAEALQLRFHNPSVAGNNRIHLSEAINRRSIIQAVSRWWQDGKCGLAVLQGDEGNGKTWMAAACVQDLWKQHEVAVLWLDSLEWACAATVEEIVRSALRAILPPGKDELLDQLRRKALGRWPTPILIVLDGANERGAWQAAERLLRDYHLHAAHLLPRVRLLFTSRPLDHRPFAGPHFWQGIQIIPVNAFTAEEFHEALRRADVAPESLSPAVRQLAMVPRYFRLCVQLRERLASMAHVSKEMLLWVDLESKLAQRDPQWLGLQSELGGTPHQILAHLARRFGWPSSPHTVAKDELLRHLPGFDRARDDLIEQRIVLSAGLDGVVLSAEHLVLGWALLLREEAILHSAEGADSLCDRLHRLLEPAASNDDKARAIHVAALLTFLENDGDSNVHIALLRLWALHHNASVTSQTLGFFVRTNPAIYASMVEAFFRSHHAGHFETTLIAPLAICWRDQSADWDTLQVILERWLRLIFPGDATGSESGTETPPPRFPAAATPEQLRLSQAAISIISFRPAPQLLPALLDCSQSDSFCYQDHDANDRSLRFPVKNPVEALGTLVRWHYGEEAICNLALLGRATPRGSEEWRDLHWFARLWRQAWLPAELGEAEDIRHKREGLHPVEGFRNWLLDRAGTQNRIVGLGELERLAVRRDMPALTAIEIEALISETREQVSAVSRYENFDGTWPHRILEDILPWLARYAPHDFALEIRELWKFALSSIEPVPRLMHLDETLPPIDPEGELAKAISSQAENLSKLENFCAIVAPLTEVMLLHGTSEQLLDWLRAIQGCRLGRSGGPVVGLLPIPTAVKNLAPPNFAHLVRPELDSALDAFDSSPDDESLERAAHWLQIYAYVVEPDRDTVLWALDLADRMTNGHIRFALFLIATRCAEEDLFLRTISHPAFQKYQLGVPARHWWNQETVGKLPSLTFDELAKRVSLTAAGQLLLRNKQDDELRKWGHAIIAAALAELEKAPPPSDRRSNICTEVSTEGELKGFGIEHLPSGHRNWHGLSSGVWGIDRNSERPSPTQEDYDRLCDELHAEMEKWRSSSRREIAEFNAAGALLRWSELEPQSFQKFGMAFLSRIYAADRSTCGAFGFFAETVFMGLLRIAPELALGLQAANGHGNLSVTTLERTLEWQVYGLWQKALNHSAVVENARRNALKEALNDEILMGHSIGAMAADNVSAIAKIALEHLASEAARERALGVTILAYQGSEEALRLLAGSRESDRSFWVREHAQWATEICATELACRQRYRELIESDSLERIAAALAEMRMALSPLARTWRRMIEAGSAALRNSRRRKAYLKLFWYHWGNVSSRQRDIKWLFAESSG